MRLIPASAFLCHHAPSQMLPASQQHLPLCDTVFPFILKSSVWGRETAKLLSDVSQPCLCLAHFCAVPKSSGVGSPGIAPLFSPDSSPWPLTKSMLVQTRISVPASNNVISSIPWTCCFQRNKGPRDIFVDVVYVGYYQDWQF